MDTSFRTGIFMPMFYVIYLIGSLAISVAAFIFFPRNAIAVSQIATYFVLFGGALVLYTLPGRLSWKETLGLHRIPVSTAVLAFLLGFLIQPVMLLISYLSQFIFRNFVTSSISEMLDMPLGLLFFLTAVLPAFFEEFLCRGLVLRGYRNYAGWIGILISAVFFALMHGNLQQCLYALAGGVIFGIMAYAADSVWPAVIAHLTVNGSRILLAALLPSEGAQEVVAGFSFIDLGVYLILTLATLPFAVLCLRKIYTSGKGSKAPVAPPEQPSLRMLWPFLLYVVLALGMCIAAEFLPI